MQITILYIKNYLKKQPILKKDCTFLNLHFIIEISVKKTEVFCDV